MKRLSRIAAAVLALSLLCGCGADGADNSVTKGNTDAENSPAEIEEIEEVDYMQIAKDFMAKIDPEITMPSEYASKKDGVNYPAVEKKSYYSTTCEKNRNVNIVLPDGYSEDKKYPVLYILHGIFGDENSMTDNGTNIIVPIQNMMAEGLAEEMILVFPYMYASKTQDVCTAIDVENSLAYDNFVNDLANDLMPFMEENYSVATGRENTAVIGFSMGGREALAIGLYRPDLFGYIGGIAPAPGLVPGKDWAMEHPGQFAEEDAKFDDIMPALFMVCSGDKDGTVGTFPKSYHELFDKNGVPHLWYEIPGSDHGNPAIQSGIYNFCKYVFKDWN